MCFSKVLIRIFLMMLVVWLQAEEKPVVCTGRLSIPMDVENMSKSYRVTLTLTKEFITMHCEKKIFRRYNDFDSPFTDSLTFSLADVNKFELYEKKNLYLYPASWFLQRYLNLFDKVYEFEVNLIFLTQIEHPALVIDLEGDPSNLSQLIQYMKSQHEIAKMKLRNNQEVFTTWVFRQGN